MTDSTNKPKDESTPKRQPPSRRPHDIDALTPTDRKRLERAGKNLKRLREIEHVIQPLVAIKVAQGSLRGTGQREEAARMLGVSVWTIDRWIDAYRADPRVESLASKSVFGN